MTTVHRDPLVDAYLRRLDAAARDLPAGGARGSFSCRLRQEHIEDALREAGARDGLPDLRHVLDRLGPPATPPPAAGAERRLAPEAPAPAPAAPSTPPPTAPAREACPGGASRWRAWWPSR